jgi:hypothetical protein
VFTDQLAHFFLAANVSGEKLSIVYFSFTESKPKKNLLFDRVNTPRHAFTIVKIYYLHIVALLQLLAEFAALPNKEFVER